MTLGELIQELKKEPADKLVRCGFGKPHSYRGYYEDLAFEPCENTTAWEMLAYAESALGKTFGGYKGGDYVMTASTDVWISEYGEASNEQINRYALAFMLGRSEP